MDPAGKTAVVTGGNSGLGRATAEALLAAGANVVSLDMAGGAPDGARFIPCDVSVASSVQSAVAEIEGAIHILVNCAGIGGIGPIASQKAPGDVDALRRSEVEPSGVRRHAQRAYRAVFATGRYTLHTSILRD